MRVIFLLSILVLTMISCVSRSITKPSSNHASYSSSNESKQQDYKSCYERYDLAKISQFIKANSFEQADPAISCILDDLGEIGYKRRTEKLNSIMAEVNYELLKHGDKNALIPIVTVTTFDKMLNIDSNKVRDYVIQALTGSSDEINGLIRFYNRVHHHEIARKWNHFFLSTQKNGH